MNVEDSYEGAARRLRRLGHAGVQVASPAVIAPASHETNGRLRDLEELATLACDENERLKQELEGARHELGRLQYMVNSLRETLASTQSELSVALQRQKGRGPLFYLFTLALLGGAAAALYTFRPWERFIAGSAAATVTVPQPVAVPVLPTPAAATAPVAPAAAPAAATPPAGTTSAPTAATPAPAAVPTPAAPEPSHKAEPSVAAPEPSHKAEPSAAAPAEPAPRAVAHEPAPRASAHESAARPEARSRHHHAQRRHAVERPRHAAQDESAKERPARAPKVNSSNDPLGGLGL